ncbi:hypothetical protein AVV36_gp211 [Pectobacterium bacteriophage PM2]|uniref:DUF7355 domain-containing protein n=1 Tax=Pectobacterium bacteriophage PM2 TaxID=1429794 RepID=A0A0A0PZN8_9CAUD|nr:hypothetical protein AVV36_gp211 [Pectobacterium bacteriophage PM2]AHY25199.1 hypothetical protein PM2_237 [Pectobacterium bacteriophage PM2]
MFPTYAEVINVTFRQVLGNNFNTNTLSKAKIKEDFEKALNTLYDNISEVNVTHCSFYTTSSVTFIIKDQSLTVWVEYDWDTQETFQGAK